MHRDCAQTMHRDCAQTMHRDCTRGEYLHQWQHEGTCGDSTRRDLTRRGRTTRREQTSAVSLVASFVYSIATFYSSPRP